MTKDFKLLFLLFPFFAMAQQPDATTKSGRLVITPEVMVGQTAEANSLFPERNPQFQVLVNFGWDHDRNSQEWAQRLKGPRTGISLGYTNLGNADSLGSSFTFMPFIEFNAFRKERLKIQTGMGVSYFNVKYDPITNPNNQGITTDITWSFRMFMHYELIKGEKIDWRTGIGYFHHSNGHTFLPNQGLNSFLLSVSADLKSVSNLEKEEVNISRSPFNRSIYSYASLRSGYGNNVLSAVYNDTKGIYTIAGEYGKVINNTFKLGGGFYYRFYQHYYDYIQDNESLVQDGREFDYFKEHPWNNATNIGLFLTAEFLLNHFGIDLQLGFNLHKPAYKIDWRINQGWDNTPRDIPEFWELGEFDSKFKMKNAISTRMGIKYYLLGTKDKPRNNLYAGFHINSNLGQADFSELSLGYVHSFNFKDSENE